jgi:hypothetical protein
MGKIGYRAAVGLALATAISSGGGQVSVESNSIKERQARPGETYVGVFVVKNSTAQSQEARLYQTDYAASADGTNNYSQPGSMARSNARWISLGPSRIVVPPNASLDVPFTVAVPSTVPLSGSYWSMVMVETVPRGSRESALPGRTPQQTMGITVRFRYAVQIVTHVGGDVKRDAKFEAPTVQIAADSSRELQFDLKNTGNLSFTPAFTVELYAEDGSHVKTLKATREITYPGGSLRQRFPLGKLPRGKYRAMVTVDVGEDAVFGAQYTLNL